MSDAVILRCPLTGKESASWRGIEGWRCGNDVCHVGPYKTEQEAIEAWNQRWVPPIVWRNCGGDGDYMAYVGSIAVGRTWTTPEGVSGHYPTGQIDRVSVEEARTFVEEKWREAYLEMHR